MTAQEAADRLTSLLTIAGSSRDQTWRTVYLSPGDADALRLAVEALRDKEKESANHD